MQSEVTCVPLDVGLEGIKYGEFDLSQYTNEPPFKSALFTVAPGHATPRDTHSVRECWFVVAGLGMLHHSDACYELRPGTMFTFDSNEPHFLENPYTDPITIFSVWWERSDLINVLDQTCNHP